MCRFVGELGVQCGGGGSDDVERMEKRKGEERR